jgi:FtsP/CotA-like multicopper oxidase with cupredoxin domain
MTINRRYFLRASIAAAIAAGTPAGWVIRQAGAAPACAAGQPLGCTTLGLSDPVHQFNSAGFVNAVPDAMDPSFIYQKNFLGRYTVRIGSSVQQTGLVGFDGITRLDTPIWGYGDPFGNVTWPGKTFQVQRGEDRGTTKVRWLNTLQRVREHLLPVDTNLHWCYSLPGYTDYSIAKNGIPIITHLHGGHSDYQFDGNPEFFYSPLTLSGQVRGPQWDNVPGGFTSLFNYDNDVAAGTLWYHDHALGITRLNVYAGLAGFYIVRDDMDTGLAGNPLDLPAHPYEKLYAIQDRMFLDTGELFYPAFPGDPYYGDFIDGEGAALPDDLFPGGGPTGLAEFFGDHMVVNGVIWPKEDVEPRNYRMRLLNGTDSRFMALEFYAVPAGQKGFTDSAGNTNVTGPLPFAVIGSDQGLASEPTIVPRLVSEPGSRYDVIFDFKGFEGQRIIMKNIGGDEPFGGAIPGPVAFDYTDRIMAFDVGNTASGVADVSPLDKLATAAFSYKKAAHSRVRNVALFEGKDEFGRLQPLLGTAQPATDHAGNPIRWPNTPVYREAVLPDGTSSPLRGRMEGSIAWHSPTTENPALGSIERWNIWNVTGDAHPVHLHLVNFEIVARRAILWDSNTIEAGDILPNGAAATEEEETRVIPNDFYAVPAGDGTYLELQPTVQHNTVPGDPSTYGIGFKIRNRTVAPGRLDPGFEYVENAPKDMVTALPDQVTIIKAHFDKPGRYVWHCHILSHEDHEMMRVLHVGEGA